MVVKTETLHAIELLKAIESTVSRIYEVFANKFPVHNNLWTQLADEERIHARWIENLLEEAASGSIELKKGRFNTGAIQSFSQYAEDILSRIQKEEISMAQAADMAIDLETSLLERKFYEVFQGDSEILQQTFSNMKAQTSGHVGKIQEIVSLSTRKHS
jgi:rubrerythrin